LLKAEEIHYLYGYDYGEQLLKNTYIELWVNQERTHTYYQV
jgi:hypothetical protein